MVKMENNLIERLSSFMDLFGENFKLAESFKHLDNI